MARRAQAAGIPAVLLAGAKGAGCETLLTKGFTAVAALAQDGDNLQDLMQDARPALTRAAVTTGTGEAVEQISKSTSSSAAQHSS